MNETANMICCQPCGPVACRFSETCLHQGYIVSVKSAGGTRGAAEVAMVLRPEEIGVPEGAASFSLLQKLLAMKKLGYWQTQA